jgi:iron complex transport system substrate-binding protein
MMQSVKVYFLIFVFLAGWWTLAFKKNSTQTDFVLSTSSSFFQHIPLDPVITSIDRSLLHQALSGNFELMARLIADWDIDAQILSSKGFQGIQRIAPSDFLHSQSLIRILQNEKAVHHTTFLLFDHTLVDDAGRSIDLTQSYNKFLPQTYASASFLLTLVKPDQIVALPRYLREHTQIYSKQLTNQIPLDIDRYNAEKLFQTAPELAFVAHYSHPATLQTLVNQGVTLYTMKNITTFSDLSEELTHIGTITNKPLQAKLLKIFIDAAICAIDNLQSVVVKHFEQHHSHLPRVLVVNFHQTFSVPTAKTLTGQILARMPELDISLKYTQDSHQANEWMAPIDKERLLKLNPDFLIIATDHEDAVRKEFRTDHALQKLAAVQNNRVIVVDESIQHSPSQYVVLAYHDLIKALTHHP